MNSNMKMVQHDDGIDLVVTCPVCHKESVVHMNQQKSMLFKQGLELYKSGALIQNAFGFMTPDERELMISGLCSKCWDSMFDDEDA